MVSRVVLGNINGAYGLKVSKPGYDVLTAAAGNLLIDSTSPGILRQRASYSLTIPAFSFAVTTVNHGLGVVPILFWAYDGNRNWATFNVWSNSTQIGVSVSQFLSAPANVRVIAMTEAA